MKFDHHHYVPCLRWKQGEYQAVLRLSEATKGVATPLIEVPEMGYDFETGTNNKSVDDHLAPFAGRVRGKWACRPCFVDLNLIGESERMRDGRHPVEFVFGELITQNCKAIPVIGVNRDAQYQRAALQVASKNKCGLCIRLSIEDAASANVKSLIGGLLRDGINAQQCDLILDLGAPNFVPIDGFSKIVEAIIRKLPFLPDWRTFSVIGSSFPPSMAIIHESPALIERREWLLYKALVAVLVKTNVRVPTFGDYTINHPDVLSVDMRLVKPSATIRYTIDDAWMIVKGQNVRDYGFEQYRSHCRAIIKASYYSGGGFSEGDNYISKCGAGTVKTGNLSTWRWVGTNHHVEKVARDIANFCGSLGI